MPAPIRSANPPRMPQNAACTQSGMAESTKNPSCKGQVCTVGVRSEPAEAAFGNGRWPPTIRETEPPNVIGDVLCDRFEVGADGVGPHHLVVLMLHDMAVPDEAAGHVELGLDAGDLARVDDDHVLEATSPRRGRHVMAERL